MTIITNENPLPVGGVRPIRDLHWMLLNEGRALQQAFNNMGSQPQVQEGGTANVNWRSATPDPALEDLGEWHRLSGGSIVPVAGRAYVLTSVTGW